MDIVGFGGKFGRLISVTATRHGGARDIEALGTRQPIARYSQSRSSERAKLCLGVQNDDAKVNAQSALDELQDNVLESIRKEKTA